MARAIDGVLYFETDLAEPAALQRGAAAARALLEAEGVDVRAALVAYRQRAADDAAELLWEQGKGEYPHGEPDEELIRLADIAEEAWAAALATAGVDQGEIGPVERPDDFTEDEIEAAMADCYVCLPIADNAAPAAAVNKAIEHRYGPADD